MNLEYRTVQTATGGFGAEGWELAAALDTNAGYGATRDVVVIFKRPAKA